MNKQIPSCTKCKHVNYSNDTMYCTYSQVEQVDRLTGSTDYIRPKCSNEINDNYNGNDRNVNIPLCGMEGKNFEYNDSILAVILNFFHIHSVPITVSLFVVFLLFIFAILFVWSKVIFALVILFLSIYILFYKEIENK